MQQEASVRLKESRRLHGALTFGSIESVPLIVNHEVHEFAFRQENAATDIIESFMVGANTSMSHFLREKGALSIRRVVRTPKRWDRIQALAAQAGCRLPDQPDARALGEFLVRQQQAQPDHFPELSLGIIKAMGPGEYVVEHPGSEHTGHFGLAVNDYTHSTAPNRRYPDLTMQRIMKAVLAGAPPPFAEEALSALATHCSERESAARKVERFMKKVAAALALGPRVGQKFDAIVTGVNPKGTFARLLSFPAEGRIMHGEKGLDVGDKVQLRLTGVNAERGFIDLERA